MKRTMCTLLFALPLLAACTTDYITPPASAFNPPPSTPLSAFENVELAAIAIQPPYGTHEKNIAAATKIQENLVANLAGFMEVWNQDSGGAATMGTLVIEPVITQIKFISASGRVMAGAMAGSSAVVMVVSFRQKETGTVVAAPEFFQRAQAMAGAYTFGVHDNMMLTRVAKLISDYVQANYLQATGGPTGVE